jgi:uncharacterized protein YdhG (YjbR/CyaY superfamily)
MANKAPANFDVYFDNFPETTQVILQQIRTQIQAFAPEAKEVISYAIPSYKLPEGYLIHFAAYKNHIGIYPAPTQHPEFEILFTGYKTGKGTVQIPLDQPFPTALLDKILKHRLQALKNKPVK